MSTKINLYKQSGTDVDTRVNFNVPRSLTYGLNARANDNGGVTESDNCEYNTLNALYGINYEPIPIQPETAAYLAFTGITGTTEVNAINKLVYELKQNNLWSKMKAVYPFVTDIRNMFGFSNDFANAAWVKFPSTVVANSIANPIDGTVNASTLNFSSGLFYNSSGNTGASNGTFSGYVKNNGAQFIQIYDSSNGWVNFDIVNFTVTFSDTMTGTITPLGNDWCKITVTKPTSYFVNNVFLSVISSGTSGRDANKISGSLFLYAFQVENGTIATAYQNNIGSAQTAISTQFKYNLIDGFSFKLVFNGGWVHSNNGATPNGVNGYADTQFNISSEFTSQTQSFSFYTPVSNSTSNVLGGVTNGTSTTQFFNPIGQYNLLGTAYVKSSAMSNGFILMSQPSANNTSAYEKGVKLGTFSQTQSALMNLNYYIAARNFSNTADSYANRQFSFATIGNGLTDTEASILYSIVQQYQTFLNRAV